mgnify:FL=1
MSNFFTYTKKQSIEMLAVGCFDGFHLGHKQLLRHLKRENSALLVIDKFQNGRLVPKEKMKELCEFDLIFVDFKEIKNLSAEAFLAHLQAEFTQLKTLVVGDDFRFGKERGAGARDIEKLSSLRAIIVADFEFKGISVHSKFIKECLLRGECELASELLGRDYAVCGLLESGQGIGAKELVATLNLNTKNYFLPKSGVWASLCEIGGQIFKSVSFIGLRSTDGKFSVESHILDEKFDLKLKENEKITLIFKKFLRENRHFDDLTLLKKQIQKDCQNAQKCLKDTQ